MTAAALADFFNTDSGDTYAASVAGSVVKEIADNAGGTPPSAATIADAVWNEAQADHVAAGSFGLIASEVADIKTVTDDMLMISTTIATAPTSTTFTLTDGLTGNDDPNNAVVSIYDSTGSVWSGPRRITDYVHASKTVTIDADTAFPLAAGDLVRIWNVSYATTAAAGSITQGDIDNIADAVWDETHSDHITALTTGRSLKDASRQWM
jgi:hypothetical protein